MSIDARKPRRVVELLALLLAGLSGCVTPTGVGAGPRWRFFEPPDPADVWTPQISSWQARERQLPDTEELRPAADVAGAGSGLDATHGTGDLRTDYFAFRRESRRALARQVAEWVQHESRSHYLPDGPVDHWATLQGTLARNGDDCDGLELLAYRFLHDLGFREDEVYRAIVFRPSDGQHHMVTLWFEDRNDPWVIDPTGAMTTGMPHLSEVPGWVPLKLFTETREYTVHPATGGPAPLPAAVPGPAPRVAR
jgi:hypothetical protein